MGIFLSFVLIFLSLPNLEIPPWTAEFEPPHVAPDQASERAQIVGWKSYEPPR
jgi:hypothetical protein